MSGDNKTIKFCPYCGEELTSVTWHPPYSFKGRLGVWEVCCGQGHGSEVLWPDDEHDEECECEKHCCDNCGDQLSAGELEKTADGNLLCKECVESDDKKGGDENA